MDRSCLCSSATSLLLLFASDAFAFSILPQSPLRVADCRSFSWLAPGAGCHLTDNQEV